jgi:hypothetical protein
LKSTLPGGAASVASRCAAAKLAAQLAAVSSPSYPASRLRHAPCARHAARSAKRSRAPCCAGDARAGDDARAGGGAAGGGAAAGVRRVRAACRCARVGTSAPMGNTCAARLTRRPAHASKLKWLAKSWADAAANADG